MTFPHDGDKGDEAVAECPECRGGGKWLTELDEMVASAIEAAIETSPEFNHGWRAMADKELIPEILDEIPAEYSEADIAAAIYRYKLRRLST